MEIPMASVTQTNGKVKDSEGRAQRPSKEGDASQDAGAPADLKKQAGHDVTLSMCTRLADGGQGPEKVATVARRRGLPVSMFREFTQRYPESETRKALLRNYISARPDGDGGHVAIPPTSALEQASQLVDRLVDSASRTNTLTVEG